MWRLVADVEQYPSFIPYCLGLRVVSRDVSDGRGAIVADMLVAYKVFREQFRSEVALDRGAYTIDVNYVEGPFNHLKTNWRFTDQGPSACRHGFALRTEEEWSRLRGPRRRRASEP